MPSRASAECRCSKPCEPNTPQSKGSLERRQGFDILPSITVRNRKCNGWNSAAFDSRDAAPQGTLLLTCTHQWSHNRHASALHTSLSPFPSQTSHHMTASLRAFPHARPTQSFLNPLAYSACWGLERGRGAEQRGKRSAYARASDSGVRLAQPLLRMQETAIMYLSTHPDTTQHPPTDERARIHQPALHGSKAWRCFACLRAASCPLPVACEARRFLGRRERA